MVTLDHHAIDLLQWQEYTQRSAETFAYRCDCHLPWGGLELVLAWCRQEIAHEWRWELIEACTGTEDGRYRFYFEHSADACAFALKWS